MNRLDSMEYLEGARIVITGGTGSLGKKLVRLILERTESATIIVFSRDEYKQYQMEQSFEPEQRRRLRYFLGDVRDLGRLKMALHGVDYVVHAAALKQVIAAEYNPFEFVRTNVIGAQNIIEACIERGVKRVVAISTDKAANPVNLYGATKLCSDKLFVAGNSYASRQDVCFGVVRYGNVVGSRGSVVPLFLRNRKKGHLPITDSRMTRFWITLDEGAEFVLRGLRDMRKGEIWIPKIPSMKIADLAAAIAPDCKQHVVGIRPGEKLHEVMIPEDTGRETIETEDSYIVKPRFAWEDDEKDSRGDACPQGFYYGSDNNPDWLSTERLARMIAGLDLPEAKEWAAEQGISAG